MQKLDFLFFLQLKWVMMVWYKGGEPFLKQMSCFISD